MNQEAKRNKMYIAGYVMPSYSVCRSLRTLLEHLWADESRDPLLDIPLQDVTRWFEQEIDEYLRIEEREILNALKSPLSISRPGNRQ